MRSILATLFLLAGLIVAPPATAQVSGRQLLSWCEGALGASVTSTFDAFQCEAYLRATIDRAEADGIDMADCLGSPQPDASDLMARIVPVLRAAAEESDEGLAVSAHALLENWLAANCRPASAPAPSLPTAAEDIEAEDTDALQAAPSDPRIELAVWQATQRIEQAASRVEALQHYLESYPNGRFSDLARLQLDDLRQTAETAEGDPNPPAAEPAGTRTAEPETPSEAAEAAAEIPPPPDPQPTAAQTRPPRYEDRLGTAERRRIQTALRDLGLYRMEIDGIFGSGTRRAVRNFQAATGTPQTGYLSEEEASLLLSLSPTGPRPEANAGASISVRNTGASPIVAIYASPTTSPNWESNHLGGRRVLPGSEFQVRLAGQGTCRFDVRIVDDKDFARELWGLDACRRTRIDFPQ